MRWFTDTKLWFHFISLLARHRTCPVNPVSQQWHDTASVRSEWGRARVIEVEGVKQNDKGWGESGGKHWMLVSHVLACMWDWTPQYFPQSAFVSGCTLQKQKQKNKSKKNQVTLCNNAPLQIKCNYRKKTLWHKVNKKNVKRHTANQDIGHFNVWLPCSSEFKGRVWQPADSYISFFWCIQKMDV